MPSTSAWLEAIQQFNTGRFFEFHEIVENQLWLSCTNPVEKQFYQGILQVGVAFYHLQQANTTGALNLLDKGLERLVPLQDQMPFCHWLNLTTFIQQSKTIYTLLQSGVSDVAPLLDALPKIEPPDET